MGWLDKLLGREGKESQAEQTAEAAKADVQTEADRREEDVAEARDETARDVRPPGT